MTDMERATDAPSAEFGVVQTRRNRTIDADEHARMIDEYGRIRTFFKLRPEAHHDLQRWLLQARIPLTYDTYLATSLMYAVVAGIVGSLAGALLTWALVTSGVLAGVQTGIGGPVGVFVGEHRVLFAAILCVPVVGGLFAAATWQSRYYYPKLVVSSRQQNIDMVLPHAIVYMYALSYGGMSLLEVIRSVADTEDVYGGVAQEFRFVVADQELLGSDVYTALQNARNLTPSSNFEQFLDDMLSVLESGGDMTSFFSEESETYLREAEDEQEGFLETLSLLAEVFVVGFVAAPLFIIVTLIVMSLIGADTIGTIMLLVYVGLPLGTVGFLVLLHELNRPYEQVQTSLRQQTAGATSSAPEIDERYEAYAENKRNIRIREFLADPLAAIRRQPLLSLAISVPAAVLVAGGLALVGFFTPTLEGIRSEPVVGTLGMLVIPFLVAAVPLSVFHERRRRRELEIASRFPDTLNILSSANRMGIPFTEAINLVSRWTTGPLADELRTVRNDIRWNQDTSTALLSFGARLNVPQLSRTMKLLADGMRSSGDLSRVLSIAAEDTRNRHRLDQARRRELSTYIAVVVMGFGVYLFVILMLDVSYLGPFSQLDIGSGDGQAPPILTVDVPITLYRLVFFHSALIMAVGSGLLAGKLTSNDTLGGLKYGIVLVAVTSIAFLVAIA